MAYNSLSVMGNPYYVNNNINFRQRAKNVEKEEETKKNSSIETAIEENPSDAPQKDVYQRLAESKAEHEKALAKRDEHLKNATVNIAQILKDFKNTGLAIGTPDDIMEDVDSYIELVKKQLANEQPDTQLIRTNLKSAASLLDKFITDTLQKPSKVVNNWLDAIFLQQVDYKYNEEQVNPNFLVKFPAGSQQAKEQEQAKKEEEKAQAQSEEKSIVVVPEDEVLKNLFIKAKRYSFAKDYKTAMDTFKEALDRAIEVNDKETESKVLFEIGNIYDKNDYLAQALTSYNRSIKAASDMNVKSKAHFSMAQIYDDVSQFESAINHYMSSISYAGESENLSAQSTSLVKIGNIYADTYKKDAFEYYSVAENLAKETSNHKIKGYVSSNIANAYNKFNEPKSALKYYSDAVLEYDQSDSPKKVAVNYKKAAEVMFDYDNPNKAKKLLHKALIKARQTEDIQLMNEIHTALENA